ncbi:MAG: NUDIX hydrolase [Pseudomonadota bacterium]
MSITVGVGVVVWKADRVLLIRRAQAPLQGEWSIPGGRVETGERLQDAALRELREETAIEADLLGLVDVVDTIEPAAPETHRHLVLIDYAARWRAGEAQAGDDASEVAWLTLEDAFARLRWSETRRILEDSRRFL